MTSQIKVEQVGSTLAVGGTLDRRQLAALTANAPTPDEILSNLEQLNESFADDLNVENWEDEMPELPAAAPMTAIQRGEIPTRGVPRSKIKQLEAESSLDDDLAAIEQKLTQPTQSTAETAPAGDEMASMRSQILELLNALPDAPSEAQINAWKRQHGDNGVHVIAFGESDVYVFTHLKRGQWKKIQELMQKMSQQNPNSSADDELKEKVLQHCCLWPRLQVEFFYNSRAGIVDSLFDAILLNSYFLTPQQTMLLTTSL